MIQKQRFDNWKFKFKKKQKFSKLEQLLKEFEIFDHAMELVTFERKINTNIPQHHTIFGWKTNK